MTIQRHLSEQRRLGSTRWGDVFSGENRTLGMMKIDLCQNRSRVVQAGSLWTLETVTGRRLPFGGADVGAAAVRSMKRTV